MSAPHFRTNPAVAAQFDERVTRDVRAAVHLVLGQGLSIARDDVPTPHLAHLESIRDRVERGEYAMRCAVQLQKERSALALVTGQENVRRQHATDAAAKKDEGRAEWVKARIAELEAQHWASLRAHWHEQAETEARTRFDAPPAAAPEPDITPRRVARK